MKKLLTLTALLCGLTAVRSQPYNATYFTAPYTALASPIVFTGATVWDDLFVPISIGFPFVYAGHTYTSLYLSSVGYIDFDGGDSTIFAGLLAELVDRNFSNGIGATSISPVAYELTGTTPNQILKIEFKNAGFYNDAASYINFQFWLYEIDNAIEVHYGANSVDPNVYENSVGAIVGIIQNTILTQPLYTLVLVGNPDMPGMSTYDFVAMPGLQGTPDSSQVYRFAPATNGIAADRNTIAFNIYPNPASHQLFVETTVDASATFELTLRDALGRFVKNIYNGTVHGFSQYAVNTDGLAAGVYTVNATLNGVTYSKQLILQRP